MTNENLTGKEVIVTMLNGFKLCGPVTKETDKTIELGGNVLFKKSFINLEIVKEQKNGN
jgi:hypothetical protein